MTMAYQTQFVERLERTPTSTAVSYRFKRPPGFDFTAGQYMVVDLGEERIHPLSLSDCPEESRFIEFTKRMTGSPFCQRLEELTTADTITVKGPSGKFCVEESDAPLVLMAGGIGITPLRSILKSQEKKRTTAGSIILLYGNKNQEDIAFREELENLQLADYRLVHVLDDPAGVENAYQGFIRGEIVAEEVANPTKALYMISGPTGMVEAIKKNLLKINIDEERIRTDVFLGYD